MSDRADLSIVIVNYNGGKLLLRTLHSLRAPHGGLRLEVLVVDNGSADGSADAVQAGFPEVTLIRAGTNLGFARGTTWGCAGSRAAIRHC